MRKILFAFLLVMPFISACSKADLDITEENILGKWTEDYSEYPYLATEGWTSYTFNYDSTVGVHIYDVFAGSSDRQMTYIVENGEIWLNPEQSDLSGEQFKIVKLTKDEMEWQRVGTAFAKGTVGSDFKHFVRSSEK